jgi:hypothetical protein
VDYNGGDWVKIQLSMSESVSIIEPNMIKGICLSTKIKEGYPPVDPMTIPESFERISLGSQGKFCMRIGMEMRGFAILFDLLQFNDVYDPK